ITTSFAVLNLFIGIIVDAMQKEHEVEADASRQAMLSETEQILEEIKALRGEVSTLKTQLAAKE
ncbi:MAG: ion transporter, partial [Pseudomonadota bacterium]